MNRRNYQKELEQIIRTTGAKQPRVLLHCCCAPCASSVLEYLSRHFQITVLWYNPNLYPQAEFDRRFRELVALIEKMGLAGKVGLMAEPWKQEEYQRQIKGLEDEPEGGLRCTACFRLRLLETARLCKHYGYDYFCTTLTLSRHKDAVLINDLGEELARATGTHFLPSDFKKRDGENRSIALCQQYDVYRQLYCGCVYSLRKREQTAEQLAQQEQGGGT